MAREVGVAARLSRDSDAFLMRYKVPLPRAPKSRMILRLSEEEEKGGAGQLPALPKDDVQLKSPS